MRFRPCIDLHNGKVKQIVGSSLSDSDPNTLQTNFVADKPASWFSQLYRADNLTGGHVIKLGPGNDDPARDALASWPGGLQLGGGITSENAATWLDAGASHVIVTSFVFTNGQINYDRLNQLLKAIGRKRLVLDLSCRKKEDFYFIVTDRWQKFTEVVISEKNLNHLASYCDEFLIHAADVEGKCNGIELDLVQKLASWSPIATTYAGGIRDIHDIELIKKFGKSRIDFTAGSALDIFGGSTLTYKEAAAFRS